MTLVRRFLHPSLWVCLISILAYWDKTALHGNFVYDDAGSTKSNVIVNGKAPFSELWQRDFWGQNMSEPNSHKSFRPITTLTFRLNWMLAEQLGTNGTAEHTYGFHVGNVLLHGIVSGMVTEASSFVLQDRISQVLTGLLFGLHPVHAEAVSNITSRGELLMSFFFLTSFLSYAHALQSVYNDDGGDAPKTQRPSQKYQRAMLLYLIPWIGMTLSMFSKEQGASTLMSLVVYDFVHYHSSLRDYWKAFLNRDWHAIHFAQRTLILALQTILVCLWRYWLNGATSPDFVVGQNPAGFASDRLVRVFSVSWVYCLYILDALVPYRLCPDWSGISIPLITTRSDWRVGVVVLLWTAVALAVVSLLGGSLSFVAGGGTSKDRQQVRTRSLIAFWAFTFCPFLLSSNLLVTVGLMKADRVIYLPLMGFCLLEALLFRQLFVDNKDGQLLRRYWVGYSLVLLQLHLFAAKVHERNVIWSDALHLWRDAYRINPISHHTIYNCGYELALKQRYVESEQVLRPIADPHVDGPSNTFVYAMVLQNLHRCDEAHHYIDQAMAVVHEKRQAGGVRNTPASLARVESNLLVARAYCTDNIAVKSKLMYTAVETDPSNEYAVQQATALVQRLESTQQLLQKPA